MMRRIAAFFFALVVLGACAQQQADRNAPAPGAAAPDSTAVSASSAPVLPEAVGQTIYVPVYSHIYAWKNRRAINLAVTLSIRNTDAREAIQITSVRYYDSHGALIREDVKDPLTLAPMASTDVVVDETDSSGGAGANFIVEWSATRHVTEPIVEAVMISTASTQGISFVSVGRVIEERRGAASGE